METEQKAEDDQLTNSSPPVGIIRKAEEQYRKIKEHAETYPYVWGSYIVVYGGFALWGAYRWRKLRKTEDRVRALQERLQKLVKNEQSASSSTSVEKVPPSAEKASQSADKISNSRADWQGRRNGY